MAHMVQCVYCKERFDRDKIPFVQVSSKRYAHVECSEKEQIRLEEERKEKEEKARIAKAEREAHKRHIVTCLYCKQKFDAGKEPYVLVGEHRYAHKKCAENKDSEQYQIEEDKRKLNEYIIKLFKLNDNNFVSPKIQKQINQYVDEYNFTYSGIHKALVYFYEIKGNSVEKSKNGIGIVPYVYKDAYNYYFSLWEAKQRNADKIIKDYIPKVEVIKIPRPQARIKRRKLFTFLDDEENDNAI